MRNRKSLLLVLTLSFFFVSCEETTENKTEETKTENPTAEVSSDGPITANVNGNLFSGFDMVSSIQKLETELFTSLTFLATSMDGEALTMSILNYSGVGKYMLGSEAVTVENSTPNIAVFVRSNSEDPANSESWSAIKGEVVITEEKNGKMKGTFNFITKNGNKGGDVLTVTDGKFDLKVK